MTDSKELPVSTCDLCLAPILEGEPFANLECSLRQYNEEEGRIVLFPIVAFSIANLCRTCGEQLQLTNPDQPSATKLHALVSQLPGLQRATLSLPPLPQLVHIPANNADGIACDFCGTILQPGNALVDIEVRYERIEADHKYPDGVVTVFDVYNCLSVCEFCCNGLPLPPLDEDSDYPLSYLWVTALVMLANGSHITGTVQ
jgi:hypothetical protein